MTVEPIEGTEPTTESQEDGSQSGASDEPETSATHEPDATAAEQRAAEAIDDPVGTDSPSGEVVSSADAPAAAEDEPDAAAAEAAAPAAEADAPAAAANGTAEADAPAPAEADAEAPTGGPEAETEAPAADSASNGTSDFADAPPAESPDESDVPVVDDRPEPTTMEELLNEQTDEIRSLKHGDVVEGQVVRIDKDEILVDIGAKSEGVVSNRELYGRNAESQPELNIGDTVLVYVLQPESNEGHAVLSLRRAGLERKWRSMQEQLDAGVIIDAPVIDHNKGGLIVDCGIRGFVPISQIVDFPRRPQNEQPRDAAQEIAEKLQPYVGRKLRLKILEVNRKANRLILSEKVALYEERREKRDELFSSLTVGQKVTGSVRSIAPFGVFVDLGGIDGLVHKSELSWNKVNNPESGYTVGEEVEAEVIDINHERGRISLSIRRLQPDPWHSTVADLKVGDVIDGTVTKIVNFGSFVRVRDGLEGLIHISELSHQRVAHPGDVVHEGQNLKLKVISLDSERHRLGLSLKQAEEAPARPAPSEPRERRPRSSGPSYDPSQAVQEPEEGIDNTLAAAFAQVRQQMAESDAGEAPAADETATDEAAASGSPAGDLGQAPEIDDAPVSQGSESPALEVGGADEAAAEATA
ncbi:MAG: 30S ribosomal protein S1, partial [Actinomycetota bacterium]|nr:30S ribosomal protein S1 [Actinomycetota bacterium]